MSKELAYIRFGKQYKKLGRYETIKEGAMQSWCHGELEPIMGTDTIGDIPNSFSDERDFYNPITMLKATPDHPQCEGCEDMAECIDVVTYLGEDAECIKSRSNRLIDAKNIKYNDMSFMDKWAYLIIVMVIVFICIYTGYKLFTFKGFMF